MVFVKAVPNNVQVLLMLVTTKYLQSSCVTATKRMRKLQIHKIDSKLDF